MLDETQKPVWKILLVDDDEDDFIITRAMLAETQGATVDLEWVSTFQEGRAAILNNTYHAVLMDYDLGEGTGLELIREGAANECQFPFVLLTGRGTYQVDMEAMQSGATMYLTKAEANSLLLERVIRYSIEIKQKELALVRHAVQQDLLLDVSRAILTASSDRQKLTEIIFERVRSHLDADVCFNYQMQSESGPLNLVAGFGIPSEMWESAQQLELGQAFCGTVAATQRPLSADAHRILTDEKGAFVRQMGVRAYACHPLFSTDGRVLGTFSLCSTKKTSFTEEEIRFLQTLAHFMALAWDQSGNHGQASTMEKPL